MSGRIASVTAAASAALLLAGCAGSQSALDPAGVQAARVYNLWHVFNWVCLAVYILSMAWVIYAACRRGRAEPIAPQEDAPELRPDAARESRATIVVGALIGTSIVILFGLLIGDLFTASRVHSLASDPDPLVIKVIGHQWWWEVQYQDPTPSNIVTSANEIHVPVGRAVRVELESADVIHSFWIPNLTGKKDMIPGHPTTIVFRADREGTFTGNCAEFCGMAHTQMRLVVHAQPREKFDAWLSAQRQPPTPPSSDETRRGQELFLTSSCVMCHAVAGTHARSRVGPDLSRIGGRSTIAAGWLPNTPEHMERWITQTQVIKPGVRMPPTTLPAADMKALVAYLESLK